MRGESVRVSFRCLCAVVGGKDEFQFTFTNAREDLGQVADGRLVALEHVVQVNDEGVDVGEHVRDYTVAADKQRAAPIKKPGSLREPGFDVTVW